jgi:hypothetical protein
MSPTEHQKHFPTFSSRSYLFLGCTRACSYGGARTVGQLGRGMVY